MWLLLYSLYIVQPLWGRARCKIENEKVISLILATLSEMTQKVNSGVLDVSLFSPPCDRALGRSPQYSFITPQRHYQQDQVEA